MVFRDDVFVLINSIPPGKVTTYKIISEKLGRKCYRAVGNICRKNENLISTPCHRVVRSDGKVGDYQLGKLKKIKLLESEGIKIKGEKIENFEEVLFRF
ncbi:MAG: MGMT family protein [Candidatus Aenigmatarchaeota archaeon]